MIRGTNDQFIQGYGLFYDIWAPFAEAVVLVTVAILGGKILGLAGVLLGNITSSILFIYIWKPYMLFTNGFKLPILKYWFPWMQHLILMLVAILITHIILSGINYIQNLGNGWMEWILCAVMIVIVHSIVTLSIFYIGTSGMRSFVSRMVATMSR